MASAALTTPPPAQPAVPRINALSTATPVGLAHAPYCQWAEAQIADPRQAALFRRMVQRGGIANRYSVLTGGVADDGFYVPGAFPGTGERMRRYAEEAPALALAAIAGLPSLEGITHLVTASCTGFMAPGLDQVLSRHLGLGAGVERLFIGFMGCYAGVTALRAAAHIVRSDPEARVLVIAVELCSLHLQDTDDLESLLAMAQFADGAAAALVSGKGAGLALGESLSLQLDEGAGLITWTIGDSGFAMLLSGEVPGLLAETLAKDTVRARITGGAAAEAIAAWAVHPGGRSILDAVERGLDLPPGRLAASRSVLSECGNMSSATVLFVLERMLAERPASGLALAFGPGLAVEGLRFGWTGDAG